MLSELPYANLRISLRRSVHEENEKNRLAEKNAAFVGWQFRICQPLKRGKRHDNFDQYCRKLGIATRAGGLTSDVVDAERKRAEELFKMALGLEWVDKTPKRGKMI